MNYVCLCVSACVCVCGVCGVCVACVCMCVCVFFLLAVGEFVCLVFVFYVLHVLFVVAYLVDLCFCLFF